MAFDMSRAAFGGSDPGQDRVQRIPLDRIRGNEKNFYSMEGLRELAESIRLVGLLDPVCVLQDGPDGYRLLSGHRRYAAYQLLREEAEGYDAIPAMVLEQMGDLSETFALITANATARELTYSEKCRQEQTLRETLEAMKAAGMEVPKNLGQYMAEQLGTSRNEVSRMHSVNEKLIPEARAKLDEGSMTAQQAYEMSRRPEEEQKAAVSNLDTGEDPATDEGERHMALRRFANHHLDTFCRAAVVGGTRASAVDFLRKTYRNGGSWGGAWNYDGDSSKITFWDKITDRKQASWAELWEALAIEALELVSKLDTAKREPSPAPDLWHEEDPEKNGTYVCMVRRPNGSEAAVLLDWRKEWQLNGVAVGSTYKVRRWTEVPG